MVEYKTFIIKFKGGKITKANTDFLKVQGVKIKNMVKSINAVIANAPIDKIEKIRENSDIEYIEEDKEAHTLDENIND